MEGKTKKNINTLTRKDYEKSILHFVYDGNKRYLGGRTVLQPLRWIGKDLRKMSSVPWKWLAWLQLL